MKFFISYCDNDGLTYARDTALVLEDFGQTAWYFDRDKTPGVPRVYEITEHIRGWCDIIIYICTVGSKGSMGQWKEIEQWDSTNKQIIVLRIDNSFVPEVIDTRIYASINGTNFLQEFTAFVNNDLDRAVKMFEKYNKEIKVEKN